MSPKFKKGRQAFQESVNPPSYSSKNAERLAQFVSFMNLKKGESEYVHFLTDTTEVIVELSMHRYVNVTEIREGKRLEYATNFVTRLPGMFDDGDGTDWEDVLHNEIGHEAKTNNCGMIVVLDPVYKKGAETARVVDIERLVVRGNWYETTGGEKLFFPEYQIVYQSPFNFWGDLDIHASEIGPINEGAFKIIRSGDSRNTSYSFNHITKPIVLPDEKGDPTTKEVDWVTVAGIPKLEDLLEALGNHKRYQKYFADKSLWREQSKFNRPGYKDEESNETTEDEQSETESEAASAFEKLKQQKAETYN